MQVKWKAGGGDSQGPNVYASSDVKNFMRITDFINHLPFMGISILRILFVENSALNPIDFAY